MAENTADDDRPQRLPYVYANTLVYLTTLELTDKNVTANDPLQATSVGKQVQTWITQLKVFNKTFALKTVNDEDLLANPLPTDPSEVHKKLQFEIDPKRRRNITIVFHLETPAPFRTLKLL